LALAQHEAEQMFKHLKRHNDEILKQKAHHAAESLGDLFEKRAADFHPFPDDERLLREKSLELANKLLSTYDDIMRNFHTESICTENREELKKRLHHKTDELIGANLKQLRLISAPVLACAKEKVERSQCTYCITNWVPWSHKHAALAAAEECYVSDIRTNSLPPGLKDTVIKDWYEHELIAERVSVFNNFLKVLIGMIAIGGGVGYAVYNYLRVDRSPKVTVSVVRKQREVLIEEPQVTESPETPLRQRTAPQSVQIK